MAKKRINNLPETSTVADTDVLAVDGPSTRKVQKQNLGFATTNLSNVSKQDIANKGIAEDDLSNVDLDTAIPQATETVRGTQKISSQQQTSDGTDNETSITPRRLKQKLDEVGITENVFLDGYIKGLTPQFVNTTTLRLNIGKARDAANTSNMVLNTAISKILATGWTSGDNQNGLPNPVSKAGTFSATGTSIVGTNTEFINDIDVGSVIYNETLGQARLVTSVSVDIAGTLTTNGINVSGSGTSFQSDTAIGDHIYDPDSGQSRAIVNIVSDTAIILAEGFDENLSSVDAHKRTNTQCTIANAFTSDFVDEDFFVGGVVANATYHMFLIGDGVGGVEAGYDWDVNAVNLRAESGFNAYRRVGSVRLNSSAQINGYSVTELAGGGVRINFEGIFDLNGDTSEPQEPVDLNLSIPRNVLIQPLLNFMFRRNNQSTDIFIYAKSTFDNYRQTVCMITLTGGTPTANGQPILSVNNAKIQWWTSTTSGSNTRQYIATNGFIDNRL